MPAKPGKLLGDAPSCHRNHLDWQGKAPEVAHQLGFIRNTDKATRLRSNNFFPGEGRAPALDHVAAFVDLVGAVNVDSQLIHLVAIKHRNAQCLQALGAGQRARHRPFDLAAHAGQGLDKFIHG